MAGLFLQKPQLPADDTVKIHIMYNNRHSGRLSGCCDQNMEEDMGRYKTEIKWGLIFVAVLMIWMVFERSMGWHGEEIQRHAVMTNLFAGVAVIIYIFALLDKRKRDFGGAMTWSQGFMAGFYITIVVAILNPPAQFVIHTFISPGFFENMIDYAVQSGQMSRSEARGYFNLKSYIIQGSLGALMMGVVTSAVVAVFTKKTR